MRVASCEEQHRCHRPEVSWVESCGTPPHHVTGRAENMGRALSRVYSFAGWLLDLGDDDLAFRRTKTVNLAHLRGWVKHRHYTSLTPNVSGQCSFQKAVSIVLQGVTSPQI